MSGGRSSGYKILFWYLKLPGRWWSILPL